MNSKAYSSAKVKVLQFWWTVTRTGHTMSSFELTLDVSASQITEWSIAYSGHTVKHVSVDVHLSNYVAHLMHCMIR